MEKGVLFCLMFLFVMIGFVDAGNVGLVESEAWQWNLTGSDYANGAVFGDIDNDGDLDMISFGCDSETVCDAEDKSYVWINNGTTFNENLIWEQNLTKLRSGSAALGDIDNDGDLDLILSRISNSRVYENNGTTFNENSTWQATIVPEEAGSRSAALGDIDNDGDLDLIFLGINGFNGTLNVTFLNNGTTFIGSISWGQEITSEWKSSPGLVDLNNDGYLDLNIIGEGSAKSYINNGTSLIEIANWSTTARDEANVAWGDIDNDGDFDYCVSGSSFGVGINNKSIESMWTDGSLWNVDLSALIWGSLMLGDYDNNGYLDVVNLGGDELQIASNNGTAFLRDSMAETNLTGEIRSSAIWGDIDNDGDLDLVVIKTQKVYISNASLTNPNEDPTPPINFSYSYSNREISLGWNNGTDNETSTMGLYYNLKLGTASNNHSIISGIYGGSGDASRGGTAFGYFGNMMQRKNFTLKVDRLEPSTTYYWSVQTIDTGLEAGNWSVAQSFTTSADLERPEITLNSPVNNFNSSSYILTFNTTVSDNLNLSNLSLWGNWTGTWHLNETNSSGVNGTYVFAKNLSSFGDGMYKWMVQAEDNVTNKENSSIRTFTLDTTAPNISSEIKTPSIVYVNNDSTLNATITDLLIGLDSVWISVNATGSFVNYSSVSSSGNNYSFILDSGNYSKDVNVSWRYYANDSVGNEQVGVLQSFVVVNSAPVLVGIPDNSTNEDMIPLNRFYNLSLYSSDADLDSLTFYVQSQSNSSLIDCFISEGSYVNCSVPAGNLSGFSTIVVNVTDGTDWTNDSFVVNVIAVNDVPWVSVVNVSAEGLNLTNESLSGVYDFGDVESSSEVASEMKWYRNVSEVTGLANLTSVSSGNTTKGENWTFSVRVYDGNNWSSWYNSSELTILNSAPDFSTISNQSWVMNSNLTLNLSEYFSDIDLDSLTYFNSVVDNVGVDINQTSGVVILVPDVDWNGTGYVVFNGSDSEVNVTSDNITLSVFRPEINYSGFGGNTTNFSNLTDFIGIPVVIEKVGSGKMSFDSVSLDGFSIDISENVNISFNRIELNSSALPELNESATLYLYNLTYSNPRPLRDGVVCSDCIEVGYSGGIFVFNVTGFSVYSSGESPTCSDGIQNGDETGVDCGGSCVACSSGGSSGGSTSVAGSSVQTYVANNEEMKTGYTQQLAKGDKIGFSLNSENHSLEVKNIIGTLVNITIMSDPVNFIILIGQELKFDLDNNSVYDLLVRLNSVVGGRANLTIVGVDESVGGVVENGDEFEELSEDGVESEDEARASFVYELIVILIIILIVVFIRQKNKDSKIKGRKSGA